MTKRQILVNVWQRNITPREARDDLRENKCAGKLPEEELLGLLEKVAARKMTVTAFEKAYQE
ncbi:MAG: hypothetical protein CO020_01255 [Candidatus Colwellbacteria bacterium CG_4_9_14_0_2_um_filter_50_12]|uniref:Uncharacterized protein n=1 Tax=Candidatus Colwellbacteria bacterium CG_4_9_14_0_2_um_filter_50_12 TaxID=1974538 RepID=A0A2M8G126_9BACT|nr:MAG: hypothetical protein CO020_01255 [Candidatus Colwellbacteria bacterium CG_4_9_14_0_2_um_filter_50_12]